MLVVILSSTGNTELPNKFDVVRVDLQPNEQYKSVCPVVHTCITTHTHNHPLIYIHAHMHKMVLAGLRPEVIMEICSRAISFWTYQVSTRVKCASCCSVWLCHTERGYWYTGINYVVQYVLLLRRTRNEHIRSFVLPRQWRRPSSRRATMSSWWLSTSPRWLVSSHYVTHLVRYRRLGIKTNEP